MKRIPFFNSETQNISIRQYSIILHTLHTNKVCCNSEKLTHIHWNLFFLGLSGSTILVSKVSIAPSSSDPISLADVMPLASKLIWHSEPILSFIRFSRRYDRVASAEVLILLVTAMHYESANSNC